VGVTYRLQCFGYPRLESQAGGVVDEVQAHPKPFALLIYLACHAHLPVLQREALLPVFWPEADESHARNSLRQTLHVLRRILGKGVLNGRRRGELKLEDHRIVSDVRIFRTACREGRLEEALALATGDFLSGFFVPRAGPFLAWVDEERRRLKAEGFDAATRLARNADVSGDLRSTIAWWQRALALSPHDEGALSNLVWALARSGNRGGALDAYKLFRQRMLEELDIEPSRRTEVAVRHALRGPDPSAPARAAGSWQDATTHSHP
jgi:DNA-binding SARP family transcriptional activator